MMAFFEDKSGPVNRFPESDWRLSPGLRRGDPWTAGRFQAPVAIVALALLFMGVIACGAPPHEDKAAGHDEHAGEHGEHEQGGEHGEEDGKLHVDGLRGVSFAPAGPAHQESAFFAAEAVSDPSAETQLSVPVGGQVIALHVAPGATVAKGAAVIELRSPELADVEARWQVARARAEKASREAEREQRLLKHDATSAREAEAASSEADVARVEEEAARAALVARGAEPGKSRPGVTVRAPRDGTLVGYSVALGENVAAGAKLATLVSPGAALVRVDLALPGPETWAVGATTEVRRSDGKRWTARVEGIPPQLAADTRRLSYYLRLDGEDRPLAGTPLEVRVPLAEAIVLPQTALQQIEGVWGVFVRQGDVAEFRPVRKGPELGGDVLVLEGIEPGDVVATEGAYLLKALQLKLAGGGAGHDH
jgi:cobalt-zinc-cadmium efflux system membrane fusion protein